MTLRSLSLVARDSWSPAISRLTLSLCVVRMSRALADARLFGFFTRLRGTCFPLSSKSGLLYHSSSLLLSPD